jgi:hypothetical protein
MPYIAALAENSRNINKISRKQPNKPPHHLNDEKTLKILDEPLPLAEIRSMRKQSVPPRPEFPKEELPKQSVPPQPKPPKQVVISKKQEDL